MKRYSRAQHSRYDKIKRTRPQRAILPVFESSGILEAESNNKDGEPLKYTIPNDAISPEEYWDRKKVPIENRPMLKAVLYKKSVETPLNEYNLELKSSYVVGRRLPKDEDPSIGEGNDDNNGQDRELGKSKVILADIGIPDPGCSKEHCVIQFREKNDKLIPYIMDLNSSNGTALNGVLIPTARYIELRNEDMIFFSEFDMDSEYELIFMDVN